MPEIEEDNQGYKGVLFFKWIGYLKKGGVGVKQTNKQVNLAKTGQILNIDNIFCCLPTSEHFTKYLKSVKHRIQSN